MTSFGKLESIIFSVVLAVTVRPVASHVFAQIDAPRNPKEVSPQQESVREKTPSPDSNKTRRRRAASSSDGKPGEVSPASAEPPDTRLIGESKSAPNSEIKSLRDEIEAATNDQDRTRLHLKLVEHLVTDGRKSEAIIELQSMSGEDRLDPQNFYNIANALARLGDADGAVNTYRKAIKQQQGRYSRAFNNLGVVLLRQGHWDEAYEAFMSALRLENFRYAEASYNLGRLYAARGENDLAVSEWRRALKVNPEHTAASKALSGAEAAGGIKVGARAPAWAPAKSRVTGRFESERQNSVESPKSTRKGSPTLSGFTVDPETYAFLQRARTARDHKRNEEAVESYRRVIARMGGYFPPANLELGYSLIVLKRKDEAIASLLPVAIKDSARFPASCYHLARIYESRGDLKLAESNYICAADSYGKDNSQILLDLSRVREKLGNLPGALASMEQYVSNMKHQGEKLEWSDERLAALRHKLAASKSQPKQ